MMLIAETRPSRCGGVTDWRKVVVLITQMIGPAPSRKKLRPARIGVWITVVSAITQRPGAIGHDVDRRDAAQQAQRRHRLAQGRGADHQDDWARAQQEEAEARQDRR